MFELMFCAFFTILPDYLFRRYRQHKRWGAELHFFNIWYELRWGISGCFILTVSLITLVFYYHPSTTNVTPLFRTVTVLPEISGRVAEVYVTNFQLVKKGDRLFSLDDSRQRAALNTAASALHEVEAQFAMVTRDLEQADGNVYSVRSKLDQAQRDLVRVRSVLLGGEDLISKREVDSYESRVETIDGELVSAIARRAAIQANLDTLLPAQLETAKNALEQAQVELDKTVIQAEISGRITQFTLQSGDMVNPMLRPAGLLVPEDADGSKLAVYAGFGQLAGQVVKPGTLAEMTCLSQPFTIIPMVITDVQAPIAAGQMRPSDRMVDLQERAVPGTLMVKMEPLYGHGLDTIYPGSKCIANAYTYNHELLASGELPLSQFVFYHVVDTVGLVHALLLRVQTLMIPVKTLVFSGH